jgi:hypothetical protein
LTLSIFIPFVFIPILRHQSFFSKYNPISFDEQVCRFVLLEITEEKEIMYIRVKREEKKSIMLIFNLFARDQPISEGERKQGRWCTYPMNG